MMFKCKHCGADVVRDEGGKLWLTAAHVRVYIDGVQQLAQYCWVDPMHGSQLHEAEEPGQKEIWLIASFNGEEMARIYIAEFINQTELDLYNMNGSPKKDQLERMMPRGCRYDYIMVNKQKRPHLLVERAD